MKDWETWKKAFEEGKQERLDNGIKDRQYGHDADDNHKISVVTAISDTAKANAYWSSDALKKRKPEASVLNRSGLYSGSYNGIDPGIINCSLLIKKMKCRLHLFWGIFMVPEARTRA